MDSRYDELGTPISQRTYVSKTQAKAIADDINMIISSDPQKAQNIIISLNQQYGRSFDKVLRQLTYDKDCKIDHNAAILVEAFKTGSPLYNNEVLDMLKNKLTLKNDFAKTMLNMPDSSAAKSKMLAIEKEIYKLPGYKAMVNQLNLEGNIQGKYALAQYYRDMAAYYVNKYNISDSQAAKRVQTSLIDSTYTYDAGGRVALQMRTLDGKPIMYNKYTASQAKDYLTNREFTKQNLVIVGLSQAESEMALRDKSRIKYKILNQYEAQPVYTDDAGHMIDICKTDKNGKILTGPDGQHKPFVINLRQIGDEDLIGVFDAKKSSRQLIKTLQSATGLDKEIATLRYKPFSDSGAKTYAILGELGFAMKNLDTSKPFSQQFERTNLSTKQIQALNDMIIQQKQFETKLDEYAKLKKAQRDTGAYFTTAAGLMKNMFIDMATFKQDYPRTNRYAATYEDNRNALKPALKAKREELYQLEKQLMQNAAIFLNYKGKFPEHPLVDKIQEHNLLDTVLWGGY